MLTRNGQSQDWGSGLPLKANLLGRMNTLDVHHIFPRAQLYKHGYSKSEVNSLANYCFLTKDTNIRISDRLPKNYFPEIENAHPGALASQWIPDDRNIWEIDRYREFISERRTLLCNEINERLTDLLHGEMLWAMESSSRNEGRLQEDVIVTNNDDIEYLIQQIDDWVAEHSLPSGEKQYNCSDETSGEQLAIFDIAWPNGIQEGYSQPIALLLNDTSSLEFAASKGFRCFSSIEQLKNYIEDEILQ